MNEPQNCDASGSESEPPTASSCGRMMKLEVEQTKSRMAGTTSTIRRRRVRAKEDEDEDEDDGTGAAGACFELSVSLVFSDTSGDVSSSLECSGRGGCLGGRGDGGGLNTMIDS